MLDKVPFKVSLLKVIARNEYRLENYRRPR